MKLLIVDDSTLIRKAIQKYAGQFGLEVVGQARDGKEALELFESKDPDLVTMDITMPEMDGITCLEQMLIRKNSTKILIVTALSSKEKPLEALQKGARGFLNKPFTESELIEALESVMGT